LSVPDEVGTYRNHRIIGKRQKAIESLKF